jgi:hypothetical protein
MVTRSDSMGDFVFAAPGLDETLLGSAGFEVTRVEDVTPNMAAVAAAWRAAAVPAGIPRAQAVGELELPLGTTLVEMAYTSAEGRQELLDTLAEAIEDIGLALAALGAAYEQLDEHNADRLEEELFGPVQRAYGRAKSAHAQFAGRHGMASRTFATPSAGIPSTGAKGFIDGAVNAAAEADSTLSELQDSSLPTEVGDVKLRAALTDVRERLGGLRRRARELERTLGR